MVSNITLVRLAPFITSSRNHPQDILPPFGVAYVASVLAKKGLKPSIIDAMAERIPPDRLAALITGNKPDLIILDACSSGSSELTGLCERLSSATEARIWSMGHFASASPEVLLKNNPRIEGCIIEEPEETAVDLIGYLNEKQDLENVKGIAFYDKEKQEVVMTGKRDYIRDLDKLPPIDYDLLKLDKYRIYSAHMPFFRKVKWGFLLTSRGCPYGCIYCSATLRQSYGAPFRSNSPASVVAQMEALINRYGVNAIAFQDDNFTFDKERAIGICNEIIRRKLKINWVIQARADCLDREILESLKKAGCVYIGVGVESGSDRILSLLQKDQSREKIIAAFREIDRAGIFAIAFFMLGNPQETYSEMLETIKFAEELDPLMIQVAFFTPYPGSKYYEALQGDKRSPDTQHHYNLVNSNFSAVPTEELIKLRALFYLKYYLRPGYISRYLRHRALYAIFNNNELGLLYRTFKYLAFGQKGIMAEKMRRNG